MRTQIRGQEKVLLEQLIRDFDWSKTPIGPRENWSPALRTTVQLIGASRFPHLLWWGPDYISIYNDAYCPILGRKHPWGLGKPVRECWSEIWHILKPLIDTPFNGGPATWDDDFELQIKRAGFTEETHFIVSYSAVPDETAPNGIGGVLATVFEITEKVVAGRRTDLLRELAGGIADLGTAEEICSASAAILSDDPKDLPFGALYLTESGGRQARLAAAWGGGAPPEIVDLETAPDSAPWPLQRAVREAGVVIVEDAERPAAILPLRSSAPRVPAGFLVAGVSVHLRLDDPYKTFLEVAANQISSTIANARAYEEEKRRAEALAELDRAKTTFFSNVSHEFRTPLTLMLGPLESVLGTDQGLADENRKQLSIAHRNSLRLLKLVNTLLDFSRIEAGRVRATFTPVDLSAFTTDLASNFRSALQAAGLELIVECAPLPEPVYVDREMWEKIILNLLSNAFKFTLEGRVIVRLEAKDNHAVLTVADTGTGIPESELPHIFERFHRVEGAKGRTYEGTGIGLALILELVKLHGGSILAKSQPGEGSEFTVTLPFGHDHLPKEHVSESPEYEHSAAFRRDVFEREAASWLVNPLDEAPPAAPRDPRPHILIADDNADMRQHVSRILASAYDVTAVNDGVAALAAVRDKTPDIILTDVMMPSLDGFGLLRELRGDPKLRDVPVILLSARAGEEAHTEGLQAGADDYITKPFNARELIARVETTLDLQKRRREALEQATQSEARYRAFITASSEVVYRMSPDWTEMRYLHGRDFIPDTVDGSQSWLEKYIDPDDRSVVLAAIRAAIRDKAPFELEHRVIRLDGSRGWTFSRAIPLLDQNGEITEWFGTARDITAEKEAQRRLREEAEKFQFMAESMPQKIFTASPGGKIEYLNLQWMEYTGLPSERIRDGEWAEIVHPDDQEAYAASWRHSMRTGESFQFTHRLRRADGEYRWHLSRALAMRGRDGKITIWIGSNTEIHDQKRAEEELRRANQDLEQFAFSASHDLQEPLRSIKIFSELLQERHRPNLNGQALQYLDHVCQGATRLEALLRDLLSYTQAGKSDEVPLKPSSADAAVQFALQNFTNAILVSGARIDVEPLPAVLMASAHLQQLFLNLIGNALKYRRGGSRPSIHISAQQQRDEWRFAVRDNGIGIEPEFKETIFGLFKRLHTGEEYSGTGIGLAICQRIVDRYHGRIWVESEPGKGSTFYFTVPL